jgi:hypothetical protein
MLFDGVQTVRVHAIMHLPLLDVGELLTYIRAYFDRRTTCFWSRRWNAYHLDAG